MTRFGKIIIFVIILAILGVIAFALSEGGKESALNEEKLAQPIPEVIPVDEDITARVSINCLFGKKQTVSAEEASIVFHQSDFNEKKEFINTERKAELEEACDVTEKERLQALEEEYKIAKKAKTNEIELLPLYTVKISEETPVSE